MWRMATGLDNADLDSTQLLWAESITLDHEIKIIDQFSFLFAKNLKRPWNSVL